MTSKEKGAVKMDEKEKVEVAVTEKQQLNHRKSSNCAHFSIKQNFSSSTHRHFPIFLLFLTANFN